MQASPPRKSGRIWRGVAHHPSGHRMIGMRHGWNPCTDRGHQIARQRTGAWREGETFLILLLVSPADLRQEDPQSCSCSTPALDCREKLHEELDLAGDTDSSIQVPISRFASWLLPPCVSWRLEAVLEWGTCTLQPLSLTKPGSPHSCSLQPAAGVSRITSWSSPVLAQAGTVKKGSSFQWKWEEGSSFQHLLLDFKDRSGGAAESRFRKKTLVHCCLYPQPSPALHTTVSCRPQTGYGRSRLGAPPDLSLLQQKRVMQPHCHTAPSSTHAAVCCSSVYPLVTLQGGLRGLWPPAKYLDFTVASSHNCG